MNLSTSGSPPRGGILTWRGVVALRSVLPLACVLALAALARLWHLAQNGFGRDYYAGAVRSQMDNWHAFIFNAFDSAGFLSLDKPPVAIWLQVASAKVFGFSGWSILFAQAVAGLVGIVILYPLARRAFGRGAATVAVLVLALTPANVAVDRSNNTESALVLALLVAAWLGMRAAETGRLALLCAAMAVVGIGFNIKMGEALILAVVIAAVFGFAQRARPWTCHLLSQAAAGAVLVAVSLSWICFFDLTPARDRPYAGSTRHNAMLEMALLHNGLDRIEPSRNSDKITSLPRGNQAAPSVDAPAPLEPVLNTNASPGPLRLLRPRLATQAMWLLPLALAGLMLAASAPGANPVRRAATGIWAGWLIGFWLVLTFAAGVTNEYYVAVLGPPMAVFAGVAVMELWSGLRNGRLWRWGLQLVLLGTAAWQTFLCTVQTGFDVGWLSWTWMGAVGLAAVSSCAVCALAPGHGRAARVAAITAVGALLLPPALTAAGVVVARPRVQAPVAEMTALLWPTDPAQVARDEQRARDAWQMFANYLIANRGDATYLVAVPNAVLAASLIIPTGLPVMAMGGYLGDDPILTPDGLARFVTEGKLRFVLLGGFTLAPAKAAALDPIAQWVRVHGRLVDPVLWRLSGDPRRRPYRILLGGQWFTVPPPELYDLRGDAG